MKIVCQVSVFLLLTLFSCKTKKSVFEVQKINSKKIYFVQSRKSSDSIFLTIYNKAETPFYLYSKDKMMDSLLVNRNSNVVNDRDSLKLELSLIEFRDISISTINAKQKFEIEPKINLPFPKGKEYRILQGYNGDFSHNTLKSKYALDFEMNVGDTICAVAEGVVVEMVEGYQFGGKQEKWKGFDNFIWIYHPKMNLISSYAHLRKDGSLVNIGEKVLANQPIAISGNTGFSTEPHLHFHMLKLSENYNYESIPYDFVEGYVGDGIKKGDLLKK